MRRTLVVYACTLELGKAFCVPDMYHIQQRDSAEHKHKVERWSAWHINLSGATLYENSCAVTYAIFSGTPLLNELTDWGRRLFCVAVVSLR